MNYREVSYFDEKTKSIISETSEQFFDGFNIGWEISSISTQPYFPRVISWLEFFNANHSEAQLSYNVIIASLFHVARKNNLFSSQTKHEQSLSFSFFKLFFTETKVELNTKEDAEYFFAIALIYGRYSGMALVSVKRAMVDYHFFELESLKSLFVQLFVKYEDLSLFTHNLCNLKLIEVEFLMWYLQGNSPRKFSNLPLQLSQKDVPLFCQPLKINWNFEDHILEIAIIISKFLRIHNDLHFLRSFLVANHVFLFRIKEFLKDLGYWLETYSFLKNVDWQEEEGFMEEFVDFFIFKKAETNNTYSILGRSFNSVYREVRIWNGRGFYNPTKDHLNISWGEPRVDTLKFGKKIYIFTKITTSQRLSEESNTMNHCAFSYAEICSQGHSEIWNVSVLVKNPKSILTIEIQRNEIVQIAQKWNNPPNELHIELINLWSKKYNYSVANYLT